MKIFFVDVFDSAYRSLFDHLQDYALLHDHLLYFIGPIEENNNYKLLKHQDYLRRVWHHKNYVKNIYQYVRKHKPDIIHLSFELRNFGLYRIGITFPFLLLLLKTTKTKVVITIHEVYVNKENNEWKIYEYQKVPLPRFLIKILVNLFIKISCKLSDKIVATNLASKQVLTDYYKIPEEKIQVAHWAVEDKHIPIQIEKRKKFEKMFSNKKIILCFGNISPRKGLDIAIKSMKAVSQYCPECLLVIAGRANKYNKEFENKLRQLPKKLDIEDKVVFTGFIDDDEVEFLFELAEMAIFYYKPSNIGSTAIHNAIKHTVPSIVSNVDSFTQFLGKNDAIFVDTDDTSKLSDTIIELAQNSDLKVKLRDRMKVLVKKYSWENTVTQYMEAYEKLI